jgi:hypothetical protein
LWARKYVCVSDIVFLLTGKASVVGVDCVVAETSLDGSCEDDDDRWREEENVVIVDVVVDMVKGQGSFRTFCL